MKPKINVEEVGVVDTRLYHGPYEGEGVVVWLTYPVLGARLLSGVEVGVPAVDPVGEEEVAGTPYRCL